MKTLSQLEHSHIAKVLGSGRTTDGRPFLAMEYVEGSSLEQLVHQKNRLDAILACELFIQIADAMAYLHERNTLHRDLKPANIMVESDSPNHDVAPHKPFSQNQGDKDQAESILLNNENDKHHNQTTQHNHNDDNQLTQKCKLIDFGLVKQTQDSQGLTKTGSIIGSLPYISPEQCKNQPITASSEIYSLGCLMYQVISGELPFDAENQFALIDKQVNEIKTEVPFAPPKLESIILQCLQKDAIARPKSMNDLKSQLAALRVTDLISTRVTAKSSSKTRAVIAAATIFGALILILAWNQLETNRKQSQEVVKKYSAPRATAAFYTMKDERFSGKSPEQQIALMEESLKNDRLDLRSKAFQLANKAFLERQISQKLTPEINAELAEAEAIYTELSKENKREFVRYARDISAIQHERGDQAAEIATLSRLFEISRKDRPLSDGTYETGLALQDILDSNHEEFEEKLMHSLLALRSNDSFRTVKEARILPKLFRMEMTRHNASDPTYPERFYKILLGHSLSTKEQQHITLQGADDVCKGGDRQTSIKILNLILKNPRRSESDEFAYFSALKQLASIYYSLSIFKESEDCVEKALLLKISKDYELSRFKLCEYRCGNLAKLGQPEEAFQALKELKSTAATAKSTPSQMLSYFAMHIRVLCIFKQSNLNKDIDMIARESASFIKTVSNVPAEDLHNFLGEESQLAMTLCKSRQMSIGGELFADMVKRYEAVENQVKLPTDPMDMYANYLLAVKKIDEHRRIIEKYKLSAPDNADNEQNNNGRKQGEEATL